MNQTIAKHISFSTYPEEAEPSKAKKLKRMRARIRDLQLKTFVIILPGCEP